MGTPKRERQKENRRQRQIEEARAERVDTVRRNVVRWGLIAVVAVAAVVVIAWIGGAFGGDEDGAPAVDPATPAAIATTITAAITTTGS